MHCSSWAKPGRAGGPTHCFAPDIRTGKPLSGPLSGPMGRRGEEERRRDHQRWGSEPAWQAQGALVTLQWAWPGGRGLDSKTSGRDPTPTGPSGSAADRAKQLSRAPRVKIYLRTHRAMCLCREVYTEPGPGPPLTGGRLGGHLCFRGFGPASAFTTKLNYCYDYSSHDLPKK